MSKKKATSTCLPLSRTAKIMNSAVGVDSVNQDIVALATKATEIFLMDFARRAYDQSSDEEFKSNILEYDDIQKLVHSDPRYEFLTETIPKRIKFKDALELVQARNNQNKPPPAPPEEASQEAEN